MKKQTIIISGASRGIGLMTAKLLAKQGHKLALFDIDIDELRQATNDKAFKKVSKSGSLVFGKMDVTNPQDWDEALEQTITAFGNVTVLINNAGILDAGNLPETDLKRQIATIDINCKGVMMGCHKVAKYMTEGQGKIINLSSASAIYGQPEIATYSASKFFVRGLTEALNIEYGKRGIKVVDVMPLWVKSNMTDGVSVTSLNRLGLNLMPNDVAKVLTKLVNQPNKKICKVHYSVGIPTKVLGGLAQVVPDKVVHFINKRVAG